MKPSLKISPAFLLTGERIRVAKSLYIYQPTVKDLSLIGEEEMGHLISVWNLTRKDILPKETDETWNMEDWDVYKKFLCYDIQMQTIFRNSVLFFLHAKVEFLKMSNSIFIGELKSGIELTQELFSEIQGVIKKVTSQKEENQRNQVSPRSKKAEEIHQKVLKGEQQIKDFKSSKGEDSLSTQIVSIVGHGHSYEEVYRMTIIQFRTLLEKIVEIENYNLSTVLSPYINKKDKGKNKHWLE